MHRGFANDQNGVIEMRSDGKLPEGCFCHSKTQQNGVMKNSFSATEEDKFRSAVLCSPYISLRSNTK